MPDQLLVEVTRNDVVESRHFGSAAVCDDRGNVLHGWGNIDKLIFPRSALKPLLAIDLVDSGASEHFGLSDAEITIACASHQGEPMHQQLVTAWLDRLELTEDQLACGADLPDDVDSAHKLLASGQRGCRVHHNCSGKHAGFLTMALHLKMSLQDFHLVDHPLQQLSMNGLSKLAGVNVLDYPTGVDGCGFPAPTMPLLKLALMVARFANPADLADARAQAIFRIQQAIIREPLYAAGHGTVVSELNQVTNGAVLAKTGAEGVLTAALPQQGLGIALKISDGSARARSAALLEILDHLGVLADAEKQQLQAHISPQIENSRGLLVGEIRAAHCWLRG
ncbi:MAG: asparaginase [Gammaproteobacteria bacterium]|nr:asparaginase [Gammaproteobacteria bacterium]